MQNPVLQDLLRLSHELGREDRGMALLGEGNTSVRLGNESFLVKASGATLGALSEADVVQCRLAALLSLVEKDELSDQQVDDQLMACRVDDKARKPSVEAVFHAWLLNLPNVKFVGHAHPITVNQILCSPRAQEFAETAPVSR